MHEFDVTELWYWPVGHKLAQALEPKVEKVFEPQVRHALAEITEE